MRRTLVRSDYIFSSSQNHNSPLGDRGMKKIKLDFSASSTEYFFDASFDHLEKLTPKDNTVIVTDENVFSKNKGKFKGWKTIILEAGEQFKTQATVDSIIEQLIGFGADRKTFLVGVGGGVVTDITGYAASIYMR